MNRIEVSMDIEIISIKTMQYFRKVDDGKEFPPIKGGIDYNHYFRLEYLRALLIVTISGTQVG